MAHSLLVPRIGDDIMHPFEQLLFWLFASDIIWGTLVALYLIIAIPVGVIIAKRRDKK